MDLTWTDASSNETGFRLERRTGGGGFVSIGSVGVNVSSFQDTSVVGSTSYDYRVIAFNGSSDSPPSNVASVATPAPPPPPADPTDLVLALGGVNQVDLTWTDNATTESGYEVERLEFGGAFARVAILGADATSYSDPGLNAGTTYTYRVRAVLGSVSSGYSELAAINTQPDAFEFMGTPLNSASDSVVYVLDASCSMGWGSRTYRGLDGTLTAGTPFEVATAAVARSILSLPPGHTFSVQTYSCGTNWWSGVLLPATPTNKQAAIAWLAGVPLNGADGSGPATADALGLDPSNLCVLLVADGHPNCGASGPSGHRAAIAAGNVQSAVVHTATNGATGDTEQYLQDVAGDHGGLYFSSLGAHPLTPDQLTLDALGPRVVRVTWRDRSSSETGFRVERKLTASSIWMTAGTTPANSFEFHDATVPASSYDYRVVAVNPWGEATSGPASVTVAPPPANNDPQVQSLSPPIGDVTGGTVVTIHGLNFAAPGGSPVTVEFGGILATNVTVVHDMVLTCEAPPNAAGAVDVRVTSPLGSGVGLGAYSYHALQILDDAFTSPPLVVGLEAPFQGYEWVSGWLRRINSPSERGHLYSRKYVRTATHDFATRDFVCEFRFDNEDGGILFFGIGSGLPDPSGGNDEPLEAINFRIHERSLVGGRVDVTGLATIGSLPRGGIHRGRIEKRGNQLTFSIDEDDTAGGPFVADMSGTFTDLAAAAPWLNSGNGRLFFGGNEDCRVDRFTIRYSDAPLTVASVSPPSGIAAGGTVVNVSGSGFLDGTTPVVQFGGTPATAVTVLNDSTLQCTTPPGAPGPAHVTVTNTRGTAIGYDVFARLGSHLQATFAASPVPAWLEDPDSAWVLDPQGWIERSNIPAGHRILRTVNSAFAAGDFRFGVTFTSPGGSGADVVHVGVGGATGAVELRLVQPSFNVVATGGGGTNGIATALGNAFNRARLEKVGNTLTLAVDHAYYPPFVADAVYTINDLSVTAPYLLSGESRLFITSNWDAVAFDDWEIWSVP